MLVTSPVTIGREIGAYAPFLLQNAGGWWFQTAFHSETKKLCLSISKVLFDEERTEI